MRNWFIIAALILSTTGPARALDLMRPDLWFAPDACVATMPTIVVSSRPAEVDVDHTRSYDEIDATARTLRGAVMAGWRTNGLALARLKTDGVTTVNVMQLSDGSWCGYLDSARFEIVYDSPMNIFISKDYAEYSCEYTAILDHEKQHIGIYSEVLQSHLKGADRRLAEEMLRFGAVRAGTRSEVTDAVESRVGKAVQVVSDGISSEARMRNAALDTPAQYMEVQRRCTGW